MFSNIPPTPVLPKIYNLFMEDSRFFLVMEYVEGINLKEVVDTKGALSEEQLLSIMEQVCSGLYIYILLTTYCI